MSLEEILPPEYIYKFVENEFISSTDFKCFIRANIPSKECFDSWLKDFEARTKTTWIVRTSKVNEDGKGYSFSRDYLCQHSSFRKRTVDGKNKNCNACLSIRIKKDTRFTRCRDEFVKEGLLAILKIKFQHSHRTDVAEAWNWLRRNDETKSDFDNYFNKGFSPSAAKIYHESMELLDGPEQLANSQRNPPLKWIYQRYEKWLKENCGGLNIGPDFQQISKKKAEIFEAEGSLVSFEYDPFCFVIVTPLMQRMLRSLNSSHSVFIDSSASCDQAKSSISLLLVATKAGAIPIAVCIHESQDEINYKKAFEAVKKLWAQVHSFNIENFMTDDSSAMKKALLFVFPDVRQLLCQFHVLQAVWRWLWNGKNKVEYGDRKPIMQGFRKIVYSESREKYACHVTEFVALEEVLKYPNVITYVENYLARKDEWCLAFRLNVKNESNNTNNYVEASVRILKEIVLCRLKAFNSLALMDFVANVMEKYYSRRLLDVAFGRLKKGHLLFQKYMDKGKSIVDSGTLRLLSSNFYEVQSESNPDVYYEVSIGVCSCLTGMQGAFCKHQAAVHIKYGLHFPNSPYVSPNDKKELAFIALGNKNLRASFLEPMMPENGKGNDLSNENTDDSPTPESFPSTSKSAPLTLETVPPLLNRSLGADSVSKKTISERFDTVMKRLTTIIEREENVDFDIIEKFIDKAENVQSGTDLNNLLNPFSVLHCKPNRLGRKIRVQPTSISRRKGVSRGSLVCRSGRPRQGVAPKRIKRTHNLNSSILSNHPNAKSHGDGH